MKAAAGQARAFYEGALAASTDDCIVWPYSKNTGGYPKMSFNRRPVIVPALVCEVIHGPRPAHHDAAHSCGQRACINPRHIRWATRRENNLDKEGHGTLPIGTRHHAAKLSIDIVREIRRRSTFTSRRTLARRYGVCEATIRKVVDRATWAWLDEAAS